MEWIKAGGSSENIKSAAALRTSTAQPVHLKDAAVFNLAEYAANYQGRGKVQRLLYIGHSCPELSVEAFRLAALAAKECTVDVSLYRDAFQAYAAAVSAHPEQETEPLTLDQDWVTQARLAAQKENDKLDVELKSYQSNLIKESIRMAYRDLGNFHHRAGDLHAAVRFHTKSREYCTLPAHVLDMCLAVIQLAFEMGNYTFVRNHVVKAESALDNGSGSLGGNAADGNNTSRATKQTKAVHLPGMVAPQASKQEQAESKEKQIIINRLAIASGLADLGQGYFARAARTLLNLDPVSVKAAASEGLSPVSPGDIAMYAVLCGLATFDRAAVKRQLVENSSLRSLWENEPHLKPILHAFFTSEYATALHLLEKHNPRHLFDIHLSQHVPALLTSIQDNAVTSFTKPFSSVSLDKMASSFAWTQDETRAHVIRLIQNGTLKARIDTKRGVLKANQPDVRRQLFENAMQVGDQLEETSRKVQLRIKLLQHDLVVKDSNRARAPTRQSTLESKP